VHAEDGVICADTRFYGAAGVAAARPALGHLRSVQVGERISVSAAFRLSTRLRRGQLFELRAAFPAAPRGFATAAASAAPPPNKCARVTSPGKGLTPCAIASVVNSHYGYFRSCFEASGEERAVITIAWGMAPSGRVVGAHVQGSSFLDSRLNECVRSSIARLIFPQADKPTGASWEFAFRRP
jgi:hypothetical protein